MGARTTIASTGRAPRAAQGGIVILDVLMAVLIFSVGILGMISLQAHAIKLAGDAKLRTDASYLVGQMISEMWVDRSNLADYAHMTGGSDCTFTGSAGSSARVTNWVGTATKAGSVLGSLPNATSQVKVETGTGLVSVTVCWRMPQETVTHNFTSTALISG